MILGHTTETSGYWVVLPTYCEADNLPVVLNRLDMLELNLNILIVDDNSPDRTGDIAAAYAEERPNIHVLRRKSKRGLGSAYLAGFDRALNAGADVVITMDGDLSHQPETLPSLIAALGDAGCVVGSRYVPGGQIENWPDRRKLLSATANRFVKMLFGMPIQDCTSGYRLYHRQVIQDILRAEPRSQGYSFQVEALRIAVVGPLSVKEVSICFVERTSGHSKMGLREIVLGAWALFSLRAEILLKKPFSPKSAAGINRSIHLGRK